MREKPTTREIYADILAVTGQRILSIADTARYLNRSRDWVIGHLWHLRDDKLGGIVAYNLAAALAASYKE